MPKTKTSKSLAEKLAELRSKDSSLRVGSLADFDMNVNPISTGNIALDNAIGVGGLPLGKVVELFGPSQSGKTTSALQTAAVHQRKVQRGEATGAILYLDYERSLDETYCRNLGLDVHDADTFIYAQPANLEDGAQLLRDLLAGGYLAICICDSVAAMVSKKELEADSGAITVGDRAKALHQMMRQVKGPLHEQQCLLIMLNHVMTVIETGWRPPGSPARKTTPGGTALVFYADVRIEFTKIAEQKQEVLNPVTNEYDKIVTSTTVQAKVVKNKVSKPQRIAQMRVRFGKGFSQPYSVYTVMTAYKLIKKSSSWLKIAAEFSPTGEDWQVQGEETIVRELETNKDWFSKMESKARELVDNYTPDQDTDDFDIDPSIDPETGEIRE
jgi:recombination protein RecA